MSVSKSNRFRYGFGFFSAALFIFSGVMGGSLYLIIVEVPNWSADIPDSLDTYRHFFKISHAGYFFQILVPLTIICLIISTVLLWNRPKYANKYLLAVLVGVILAEVFTLIYFLPKNFILFFNPLHDVTTDELMKVSSQWQTANYLRIAIIMITMGLFLKTFNLVGHAAPKDLIN
jgi:hypothetical protein